MKYIVHLHWHETSHIEADSEEEAYEKAIEQSAYPFGTEDYEIEEPMNEDERNSWVYN